MIDGYARYKGYDFDGGARAVSPADEHTCCCGQALEYGADEPETITCPECGIEWETDAEGGYGDDGQGWRWWLVEEVTP